MLDLQNISAGLRQAGTVPAEGVAELACTLSALAARSRNRALAAVAGVLKGRAGQGLGQAETATLIGMLDDIATRPHQTTGG